MTHVLNISTQSVGHGAESSRTIEKVDDRSPYDRVRSWQAAKQLWSVDAQFKKMCEEVGELDEAIGQHRPRELYTDAVGDSTITCITLYGSLQNSILELDDQWQLPPLETVIVYDAPPVTRLMSIVGYIAHDLNRPGEGTSIHDRIKRLESAAQSVAFLFNMVRADAQRANLRFLEDCFLPTVETVLARKGTIQNGTFVKET